MKLNKVLVAILLVSLIAFLATGCDIAIKVPIQEAQEPAEEVPETEGIEEEPEQVEAEEPSMEDKTETEQEMKTIPEEESSSVKTTLLEVKPKTVKPNEELTLTVTPNEEYGYKTTIKIYDLNKENEEKIKQVYIKGCGNICKKEESITLKAEYSWKGDYCARVIDVETNKEVEDCFKVI